MAAVAECIILFSNVSAPGIAPALPTVSNTAPVATHTAQDRMPGASLHPTSSPGEVEEIIDYRRRSARLSAGSRHTATPIEEVPAARKRGRPRKSAPNPVGEDSLHGHPVKRPKRTSRLSVEVQVKRKIKREVQVKQEVDEAAGPSTSLGPPVSLEARVKVDRDEETRPIGANDMMSGASTLPGPSHGGASASLDHPMSKPTLMLKTEISEQSPQGGIPGAQPKTESKSKGLAASTPQEVRSARFRTSCPKSTMDRAKRVRSQRMFLVNREKIGNETEPVERFKVLGSTGNVYTIHISRSPECDCPDCSKGNIPCKHIIFVFFKVLKVPETSTAWYQKGLTLSELSDIFNAAPPTPNGSVLVSTKVQNAFLKATGAAVSVEEENVEIEKDIIAPGGKRLSAIGEDCPVCYEEMTAAEEKTNKLVFDEAITGCGKPLHRECFQMWLATVRAKGDAPTCVWCRTPWPVAGAAVAGGSKGTSSGGIDYSALGYINMADVAGMSRSRDTSSYYHGPMRGRRMWEPRYEDD